MTIVGNIVGDESIIFLKDRIAPNKQSSIRFLSSYKARSRCFAETGLFNLSYLFILRFIYTACLLIKAPKVVNAKKDIPQFNLLLWT